MKPWIHAKNSVRDFGGRPEDYIEIHDFIDSSKAAVPDMRHRACFHSSFGIFIVEKVFCNYQKNAQCMMVQTPFIKNADGAIVQVRDIAEKHVLEDMGRIPTLEDYYKGMPIYEWLGGPKRVSRFITMDAMNIPLAD